MREFITIILILLSSYSYAQYRTDILGEGYEALTMQMQSDNKGAVISTLIRKKQPTQSHKAVLYIHGYNDYFFQKQMGDRFTDSLYNFYALDLRRYGRSMVDFREPFEITDLSEYFEDINGAISNIISEGSSEIVIIGHSTGGLIASLYCDEYCNSKEIPIAGLILNSPFFDMNMSWIAENIGVPIVSMIANWFDNITIQSPSDIVGSYAQSIHSKYHGEWDFDTSLKSVSDRRITSGWMRAIHIGHKTLQSGLDIKYPILLLYSDKSVNGSSWSEEFLYGDAVLDVDDISKYGDNIGSDVKKIEIKDGMHDLILSKHEVRETVYNEMFSWLYEIGF